METQPIITNQPPIDPAPIVPILADTAASDRNFAPAPKPSLLLPIILSSLITIIVLVGVYFLFLNKTPQTTTTNPTPTSSATIAPSVDPTANWKTYSNSTIAFSLKIPDNWVNYSMSDFSTLPFTGIEETLYLGPKESLKKPPQLMQISSYKNSAYKEQEVYPAANCTITDVVVGIDKQMAKHKICEGMESSGYITIKTNQYVFIIDELQGGSEDHALFTQILSTFKLTN